MSDAFIENGGNKFFPKSTFQHSKKALSSIQIYLINKIKRYNYSFENAFLVLITNKSMKLFWQAYIASSIWQKIPLQIMNIYTKFLNT